MFFSGDYMLFMIVTGALSLVGAFVSNRLKSKFNYYSQVGLSNGMSG